MRSCGISRKRLANLPRLYRKLFKKIYGELREDLPPCKDRNDVVNDLFDMLENATQYNISVNDLFPEGYDAFYNDLLLSIPSYMGKERTRKTQKRRIIIASVIVLSAVFAFCNILFMSGWVSVNYSGISYIATNLNRYAYSSTVMDEKIEFTVDLNDMLSNIGKIVYQNDNCYIEIFDIKSHDGNVIIYFRSHGVYSYKNATLISGIKHNSTEQHFFTYSCEAMLQHKSNGKIYNCSVAGDSGINYKDGDVFGSYIFSEEYFRNEDIEGAKDIDSVVLVLQNLTRNEWYLK